MSKHTEGPWRLLPEEADKPYIRVRGTRLGLRYKIANIPTPVYEGAHERELKETQANARLICAAPELMEFAMEFLEDYRSEDGLNSMKYYAGKAHAAIAKALGETNED